MTMFYDGHSEHELAAMQALFAFSRAMKEGSLSITDLVAVMDLAIESGHDAMSLHLSMAMVAVQRAKEQKERGSTP